MFVGLVDDCCCCCRGGLVGPGVLLSDWRVTTELWGNCRARGGMGMLAYVTFVALHLVWQATSSRGCAYRACAN